ncbi:hypothetical protein EC844_11218 [Acinetobacter calcoaceticus]|uniref:Uncharacterized protein n=1 Tax=Acinetobacter calcoaceticus TaxID=471 RepID=A0A4R1XRW4_ACICA|nr:hypothetical protein EC844_11218 [Acinetobacter calcoaceticus]
MLKILISVLIGVSIMVSTVVILYWRDAQYQPTGLELFLYFVLIPVGLSLILTSPYLAVKWYQKRKLNRANQAELQAQPAEVTQAVAVEPEVEWLKLKVFSSAVYSALGENQALVAAIVNQTGPVLDPHLVDGQGNPILSFRISDLDALVQEQEQSAEDNQDQHEPLKAAKGAMSRLHMRMNLLLQQQLQQHTETLFAVAEHMQRSALFYDHQMAYEYRMHPAWINPDADLEAQQDAHSVAREVKRLDRLKVYIILSENVLHHWDESASTEKIHDYFIALGLLPIQIQCQYCYLELSSSYSEWLQLLAEVGRQVDQVTVVLVADSDIDQDNIDDKIWVTQAFLPAEFASSCVIAAVEVSVENIQAIKMLHIAKNQNNVLNSLETLDIEQLEQYQKPDAFVSVLENPREHQVIKKLQLGFETTPIESVHYLYSAPSLGHTVQLSKFFGFMLAMQLEQVTHSLVYSTHHPSTQVFIAPADEIEAS